MSTAQARRPFDTQHVEVGKLFDKLPPHAIDAERALIGSMIFDWQVIGEVLQIIRSADDFYKQSHAAIYQVLIDLYDREQQVDLVLLKQRLDDLGQLEDIGGVAYLVEIGESVPSATSAAYYARIVRDKAIVRHLIDAAGTILYDSYHSAEPAAEVLDVAEQRIFQLRDTGATETTSHLKDLLQETYEKLEAQDEHAYTGLETGFFELDELLNGLQYGEMIIIAARPSMGKAQPLDAKVLTPDGYVTMGDLEVGDPVASIDGQTSRVVGVFPQGQKQIHRITLSDGRSTECCDEHLWQVDYRGWDQPRVLSTGQIRRMLTRKRYVNRLWIEPFAGRFGCASSLPVDAWLLGLLLGDGNIKGSAVRFSSADAAIVERVEHVAHAMGLKLNPIGGYDYRIVQIEDHRRPGRVGVHPNPLKEVLKELRLWDLGADQKFIPQVVFESDFETRRDLLAGLIDSDGWVESWGSIRWGTASRRLADDVISLMRSLGGSGSWTRKRTWYTYANQRREGLPAYVCNLQHPDPGSLGFGGEKGERVAQGRTRQRRLNIVSIEPTRMAEAQCIAVSHPSRLYITDDYIVTHNTALALNMAEHIAVASKQPVAVFSLEMSRQQLAQRLLCSRSGVDSHRMRRNRLTGDDFQVLANTVGELSEAPLYIDDTPGLSLLALRAKARRLAARHDIKAVFVDYMQLMSNPGAESRQQEVSNISRGIKALSRELNVPVVCLSQLNRSPEGREGHRPRMSDLRESGSIEQDADVVIMLHREDYYHRDEDDYNETNVADVIITKQRNGPIGTVKLQFHGQTTRFHNLSAGTPGGSGGGSGGGEGMPPF